MLDSVRGAAAPTPTSTTSAPHSRWRCLIDGRSGSGKTELGRAIAAAWPEVQLIKLDDFYPGWDGLDAASAMVPRILSSLRWQEWDWVTNEAGEWHELDGNRPIVVEGVGALSRASKPLADHTIWVELDDSTRKKRALERDGETYAPHWERWARQELLFIAREKPKALADEIRDGNLAASWP
ncbi:AAA family ATPase [Rhodoglobus aureus]|uniref:AAA family ATPase n=1 Tax=Rhodoglobus aureus TaxID=191497 RepID=A0ABP4G6Q9_9MICO